MKTLIAALVLSSLTAPVMALNHSATAVQLPSAEDFGRRSGRCPHHPEQPLIPGQVIAREGSTCGGV